MNKRIFALLLAMIMLAAMIPATGEEEEINEEVYVEENLAVDEEANVVAEDGILEDDIEIVEDPGATPPEEIIAGLEDVIIGDEAPAYNPEEADTDNESTADVPEDEDTAGESPADEPEDADISEGEMATPDEGDDMSEADDAAAADEGDNASDEPDEPTDDDAPETAESSVPAANSVKLNKKKATLYMGMKLTLKATVSPADASQAVTWSTSNKKVARVSSGVVTPVKAGKATITAKTANGKTAKCVVTVKANKITIQASKPTAAQIKKVNGKWTLQPKSLEFLAGGKLAVEFYVLNGTAKTSSYISNMKLKIALSGKLLAEHTFKKIPVKAKKKSYAVVKVTFPVSKVRKAPFQLTKYKAGKYAFFVKKGLTLYAGKKITYKPVKVKLYTPVVYVTKITIPAASVGVGETTQLEAAITPANAKNRAVTWSSSNKEVATVSANGVVTGIAAGKVTITAKAKDEWGATGSCTVTVVKIPVTGITFNREQMFLEPDGSATLTAVIAPGNATEQGIIWTTSNSAVATVDDGKVTAIGLGTAIITAAAQDDPGITAQCVVNVVEHIIPVTSITITPLGAPIHVGKTVQVQASALPNNATDKSVEWSSNDAAVATVDANGLVTAVSAGTATITVTALDGSGANASIEVTVIQPIQSVTIPAPAAGWLTEKTALVLTAEFSPDNASNPAVTWSSSDPLVATIDANGQVTALKAGKTTITATAQDGSGISGTLELTVDTPYAWTVTNGAATITGYTGSEATVTIPAYINGTPVKKIGCDAFMGNKSIVRVRIPDMIEEIYDRAFKNCENLTYMEPVAE